MSISLSWSSGWKGPQSAPADRKWHQREHLWQQWAMLQLEEGVLQRRWDDARGRPSYWVVLVSRALRQDLLRELYSGVTSSHLGEKILSRSRQRFYWVGMRWDMQEWSWACEVCCAHNGPRRRIRAPLQFYQVGAPLKRVAVDIVCVTMDYFIKWPEAYALPNHEAETVVEALVMLLGCYRNSTLARDESLSPLSSRSVAGCWGLRRLASPCWGPSRMIRFNRTLMHKVAKYCSSNQRDWDVKLSTLLMAYQSSRHEATTQTPVRLMFGWELRFPVDLAMGQPPQESMVPVVSSYLQVLTERLDGAHRHSRDNMRVAWCVMKTRYDWRSGRAKFDVGDQVWLHNPLRWKGFSPKLLGIDRMTYWRSCLTWPTGYVVKVGDIPVWFKWIVSGLTMAQDHSHGMTEASRTKRRKVWRTRWRWGHSQEKRRKIWRTRRTSGATTICHEQPWAWQVRKEADRKKPDDSPCGLQTMNWRRLNTAVQ